MEVIKGHKILLDITPEYERLLVSWCGVSRWAYNYGLERKKASYKAKEKNPSKYTLAKEIVKLKQVSEYAWLRDAPKSVPRLALSHLETAYTNFFKRIKKGNEKPGFPKFKSKKHSRLCFHLEPDSIAIENNKVRIPKIGWIRMRQPVRFVGKLVGTICISYSAGRWYASFNVKTEIANPIEKQERVAVGVDVGIKHLGVLSDGKIFDNPRSFYHLEKLLARAQRQMARKQKGSKRWDKAKLRTQRIHKRIADLRANATHHISSYIINNYDGIAIEKLNVSGMAQNRHLAKSILDANMSKLHQQLIYKADWSGGEIRQVNRFFPSSRLCSACGQINKELTLADRKWICQCGSYHNRDINAAINLVVKCFGPMTGGPWALRVKGSKTPNEMLSGFPQCQ
ncbi:MAG: RNA-guided endonuclease InsQ/TnpB family protein [Planctomycetota bacterium]|jgi:putative transposase